MTQKEIHKLESAVNKAQDALTRADSMIDGLTALFAFRGFDITEPCVTHASGCDIILTYDCDKGTATIPINEAVKIMARDGYITPNAFLF